MSIDVEVLKKLAEPFPKDEVNLLPKQVNRDDKVKGVCKKDSGFSADGVYCGGWHAKSVHLDYVGHAALTARLLEIDPLWDWEPLAYDDHGLPMFDTDGGLWIKLTVGGITRLGYGSADGKKGGNAVKEIIGDALRNAAMRRGAALDLWKKTDKRDAQVKLGTQPEPAAPVDDVTVAEWVETLSSATSLTELARLWKEAGQSGSTRDVRVVKAKDDRKRVLNKDMS